MAKEKKMVEAITSMDVDFAQWYTDVVKKAELCGYTSVKGCMAIKPAGYAIWENIQKELDRRFKETGVENVYMPMFIPESLLDKEKDHVEGFAPEVAWVTQGGLDPLQERLCVRPTSETLFCDFYQKEIQSHRDLPKVYNQWCSVVRWEKTTRPFLRSREFLWQEGHTAHATAEEAKERTIQMLNLYADFCEEVLAIPQILKAAGIRVKADVTDKSPGFKFAEQEMRGIPVRIECGPKDIESGQAVICRRDTREKYIVKFEELAAKVQEVLDTMQKEMLERARAHRDAHTYVATNYEEFKETINTKPGFVKAMWCGNRECEDKIKEDVQATSRCMPFEQEHLSDVCVCCGKPAKKMVYWGRAY